MKTLFLTGSFLTALILTSCYDPHAQSSPIVREVEAAGAGNLSTFTEPGVTEWFGKHPDLDRKILAECAPIFQRADANWYNTAEGTVCRSARRAEPPPVWTADPRRW